MKNDIPRRYWEVNLLFPHKITESFDHHFNEYSIAYKTFFDENMANIFQLQQLEIYYDLTNIHDSVVKMFGNEKIKQTKENFKNNLKEVRKKLKRYEKTHAEYFV